MQMGMQVKSRHRDAKRVCVRRLFQRFSMSQSVFLFIQTVRSDETTFAHSSRLLDVVRLDDATSKHYGLHTCLAHLATAAAAPKDHSPWY